MAREELPHDGRVARQPACTVAPSPPCAPTPGISSGSVGASRARARSPPGKVAPTTRPSCPFRFHGPCASRAMCSYSSGWPPPSQALVLQVVAARVGGAAQQEGALARVLQVGLHRIEAHEGRQRDGVRAVALEGLARVLFGGRADVAALGVQDHRHVREARACAASGLPAGSRRGALRSRRSAA